MKQKLKVASYSFMLAHMLGISLEYAHTGAYGKMLVSFMIFFMTLTQA